jgi:hypothetical protein
VGGAAICLWGGALLSAGAAKLVATKTKAVISIIKANNLRLFICITPVELKNLECLLTLSYQKQPNGDRILFRIYSEFGGGQQFKYGMDLEERKGRNVDYSVPA